MENQACHRIFILPESSVKEQIEDMKMPIIKLKHPRTGTTSLCTVNFRNKEVSEIVQFSDKFSSWFIKDTVEKDGILYLMTAVDPLFYLLPYLNQDGKFCPLEDLAIDEDYPDLRHLLICCNSEQLSNICDIKDAGEITVYRYSKRNTLSWLKHKVKQVAEILETKEINLNDGSKIASLIQRSKKEQNQETYLRYSCQLLSEYLSEEISDALFNNLGFSPIEKEETSINGAQGQSAKKLKLEETVNPVDDYSKMINIESLQPKQKTKLTVSQKKLLKVDKSGMKNISSFFKKN